MACRSVGVGWSMLHLHQAGMKISSLNDRTLQHPDPDWTTL